MGTKQRQSEAVPLQHDEEGDVSSIVSPLN